MSKCAWILIAACFLLFQKQSYSQWVQTKEPSGGMVYDIEVIGNNIFAVISGCVYMSTDNGTSWNVVDSSLPNIGVGSLVVSDNTIFAITSIGVYRSINNGASWNAVNVGLPVNTECFSLTISGRNIALQTNKNDIYSSTDNGTSWNVSNSFSRSILSIALSGNNIFAATIDSIYRSADNGISWTVNYPLSSANPGFEGLTVSGSNLLLSTELRGVYLSTDNGTTWAVTLAVAGASLLVKGSNIFAFTPGSAIFLSTDNGTTWNMFMDDNDITDTRVRSLAMSGNNLFVGTDNGGIWRRPLSEMIVPAKAHPHREIPRQAELKISPLCHTGGVIPIDFTISQTDHVSISIYSMTGKRIESIVNKTLTTGSYRYNWNTKLFSPGSYTVKLQAGGNTCTRPIQILH